MTISNILIIGNSAEYPLSVFNIFESYGIKALTTPKVDVARKILSDSRPELILVDCDISTDPLFWLKEADRFGLATQIIAMTEKPDFDQSMAWIAGGILNVLSKPVDASRLQKALDSANDNSEALRRLCQNRSLETVSGLADFYRGLCGRLNYQDLKKYIVKTARKLTGASLVELRLSDLFSASSLNFDAEPPISIDTDDKRVSVSHITKAEMLRRDYHFSFNLTDNGLDLGEIYFHFADESDLKMTRQEDLIEMIMAISSSLGASALHSKTVKLAAHDPLTGLYNRRIFTEVLKREFAKAQRHNYPLTLLVLDLDHFKKVNDTYGHQAGDEVLKTVAATIKKVARNTDMPVRLGGEEFAVVLTHTNQEQAMVLAKRLKNNLAKTSFEAGGTVFTQTVSQGISGLEHFMVKSPEDMLYWADQSLYLAKNEGRDTIRMASDLPMTPIMKDGSYAFQ